jgi:hypothetical protein
MPLPKIIPLTEQHAEKLKRRLEILWKADVKLTKLDGEEMLSIDEGQWEVMSDEKGFGVYVLMQYPGSYEVPPDQDMVHVGSYPNMDGVATVILSSVIQDRLREVNNSEWADDVLADVPF